MNWVGTICPGRRRRQHWRGSRGGVRGARGGVYFNKVDRFIFIFGTPIGELVQ